MASNFSSAEFKVYVTVIPKETIVTHIEKEAEQVELKVGETNVKVTSKMEPSVYVTYKVIVTEPQIVFIKDVIYFDVNDLSNANLNDYLYNTLNKPIRWAEPILFLYQAMIPYVFNSSVKDPSLPLSLSPRRPWPI